MTGTDCQPITPPPESAIADVQAIGAILTDLARTGRPAAPPVLALLGRLLDAAATALDEASP
ncbi:hypothetical protein AiwAL_15990 [Acidiphilium sp. AL]|uniref:Uncharacterized protein n=1 Tax=Acidiphilium iwatense TaxID=768198 RepID=A0ABS9DYG6_9PROT|nr:MULTISPECIES: hypothetical protein [Acidiphilium]MCF3947797.1 hypothetical protein [Acidiphilium iwatense]MCU4161583.1 hypothetical protein [Acidiphilium sp. AL]